DTSRNTGASLGNVPCVPTLSALPLTEIVAVAAADVIARVMTGCGTVAGAGAAGAVVVGAVAAGAGVVAVCTGVVAVGADSDTCGAKGFLVRNVENAASWPSADATGWSVSTSFAAGVAGVAGTVEAVSVAAAGVEPSLPPMK